MEQRGVALEDVFLTLRQPDEDGLRAEPGRLKFRKTIGEVTLDVVFEELPDRLRVITVIKPERRVSGRH